LIRKALAEIGLIKKITAQTEEVHFEKWCHFLLDQAVLIESGQLKDPVGFVKMMNEFIVG
jgi:HSP90 family molecular chaperone